MIGLAWRALPPALKDIKSTLLRLPLATMLGWQDVRQRYRRSRIGPFWLTISMGVMIATIGVVFGQIFKASMREFFPFLSIGLILWGFISTSITEGCTAFIAAESIVKQLPIPLPVHIVRVIWRNMIIFAHNIVIFPITLLVVGHELSITGFLVILGLPLLFLNIGWVILLLSVICARYRDVPQIVLSLLQVVMYVTPVMWMPELLPQRAGMYILTFNPVYHWIEVVREPLLGRMPDAINWYVSLGTIIVGWLVSLLLYGRYRTRVAYWL